MELDSSFSDEEKAIIQTRIDDLTYPTVNPRSGIPFHWTLGKLVFDWKLLVDRVESADDFTLDEYSEYMRRRDLLETLVDSVDASLGEKLRQLLNPWDERFLSATTQTRGDPLPYHLGEVDQRRQPWWFRVPTLLPPRLRTDLKLLRFKL